MKKKRVKAEIDSKGRIYFWKNDEDGLSQQDFIVILMSIVLFGGIGIGLIAILLGMTLPASYIELIKVLDIPFATVIGGIFTVKTTDAIVNRNKKKEEDDEKVYIEIEENKDREEGF